jgi:hypothetical protein
MHTFFNLNHWFSFYPFYYFPLLLPDFLIRSLIFFHFNIISLMVLNIELVRSHSSFEHLIIPLLFHHWSNMSWVPSKCRTLFIGVYEVSISKCNQLEIGNSIFFIWLQCPMEALDNDMVLYSIIKTINFFSISNISFPFPSDAITRH